VDKRWREIVFTGDVAQAAGGKSSRRNLQLNPRPERGRPGTPRPAIVPGSAPMPQGIDTSITIGRISDVANDGQWHTAQFDLLTALRKANLGTRVEALAFAAPDREYLRCGIGGNHQGATYWISNFTTPGATKAQNVAAR
jgi:hypothetical protein